MWQVTLVFSFFSDDRNFIHDMKYLPARLDALSDSYFHRLVITTHATHGSRVFALLVDGFLSSPLIIDGQGGLLQPFVTLEPVSGRRRLMEK